MPTNPRNSTPMASKPNEATPTTPIKGRITLFSHSNCRDSAAIRSFLRSNLLPFAEVNLDVFPSRTAELHRRASTTAVPQLFFNEHHVGGLDALNALRNSGEFDAAVREWAGAPCPASGPQVPVFGLDDEDYEEGEGRRAVVLEDELLGMVRIARQRVPIRDRWVGIGVVRNCFAGSELVDVVARALECSREQAIEIGKKLTKKHFIHHIYRDNEFEDNTNQLYHFLEHDPMINKCFNFRGFTIDDEPKAVTEVGDRLVKLMIAILEAYASDDYCHLDYARIAASEELRRYINHVQLLQRVDVFTLSGDEKLAFFMNLYNAMVIHAIARAGHVETLDGRAPFFSEFHYMVGGYPYSLSDIKNGILRSNRRQPYTFSKPFSAGDRRIELALEKVNLLVHFGLCDGTRSGPKVRFFSSQGVEAELRHAAREFFQGGAADVDLENRVVSLTSIIKWYSADFGEDRDILKWVLDYLDSFKAGLLMHLLNDGGSIKIVYQKYDYSLNY